MKVPTHTTDGLLFSKWGRISNYAKKELNDIRKRIIFVEIMDEKELVKQLTELIDTINNE